MAGMLFLTLLRLFETHLVELAELLGNSIDMSVLEWNWKFCQPPTHAFHLFFLCGLLSTPFLFFASIPYPLGLKWISSQNDVDYVYSYSYSGYCIKELRALLKPEFLQIT